MAVRVEQEFLLLVLQWWGAASKLSLLRRPVPYATSVTAAPQCQLLLYFTPCTPRVSYEYVPRVVLYVYGRATYAMQDGSTVRNTYASTQVEAARRSTQVEAAENNA